MRRVLWLFAVVSVLAGWGLAGCGSSESAQGGSAGAAGGAAGASGADAGGGSAGSGTGGAGLSAGGTGGGSAGSASGGAAGSSGTGGASAAGGTAGSAAGGTAGSAAGGAGGAGPLTASECFAKQFVNPTTLGPDYDQFSPVVGSHCKGTNHQDITGVERVVFIGDSVTVGSPPTLASQFYRSILADRLAQKFGIQPPSLLWKQADLINGTSLVQESGAFASCAKWGARTDDYQPDAGGQIDDCFPPDKRNLRTLVITTMGGNDIANITQNGANSQPPHDQFWAQTRDFVQLMREAVEWFKSDPAKFPNGVFVVFANMYEFTDGTGDTQACPAAGLAGIDDWQYPNALADMVIWANEQYLKIAVDTGADMIFMLESFCGHGYNRSDTSSPCYRGPGAELWFDLTCIHPNPAGHAATADLFMSVVDE